MTQQCTSTIVIHILETKVGIPANIPDIDTASWETLGIESLGLTETFSSLSLALGVDIPHEEALNTKNVQDLVELVNALLVGDLAVGYIRNAVLIQAPVEDVFKLTNNVRTWPELFTEYQSSEVIEETNTNVTFRLTTHPNEDGQQWSWIAQRHTNQEQRSTYSERQPSSGPFEQMKIRWWYDSVGETSTVMTWEQEFTLKADAHVTAEQATAYLNGQTKIQQQVIKEKIEHICSISGKQDNIYRGVIVGRYQRGSESAIADAFKRSDETELPHLLGVKSRNIWVIGDIYLHLIEAQVLLSTVIKEYAQHPLFKTVKTEVDAYVQPLSPDLNPGVAREIYHWESA